MAYFQSVTKEKSDNQDDDKKEDDTNYAQSKTCANFEIFQEADDGIDIAIVDDIKKKNKTGRWPNATVPYTIDKNVSKELSDKIHAAINEFHDKTPIKWIPKEKQHVNYSNFVQAKNNDDCYSQLGCNFEGVQRISLTEYVPATRTKLTKVGIMHEMMHCLGFLHEHQRRDATKHHKAANEYPKWDIDFQIDDSFISIGNYDYQSIMHYNCSMMLGSYIDIKTEKEMKKYVGTLDTFSQGDISGIKILYGLKDAHYGDWHRACSSVSCTEYVCYCKACGKLKGGLWCGFHGKRNTNGHWTCCMQEDKNSQTCHSRGHTGFWHMACESSYGCSDSECKCGACGAGCKHIGLSAHWSCCYQEDFDKWCSNSPFTNK